MALQHSPSIVTNGLVLCLDAANPRSYSGSGTSWNDASGNGNNAILVSSPTFNVGASFSFNGTSSAAYINSDLPNFPLTRSIWFNITSLPVDGTIREVMRNALRTLISHRGDTTPTRWDIGFRDSTSSRFWSPSTGTITTGVWHNITIVIDTLTYAIYYDNVVQASGSHSGSIFNETGNVFFASYGTTGQPTSRYLACQIGNVCFYNRALSATEISQNFNAYRGRYGI